MNHDIRYDTRLTPRELALRLEDPAPIALLDARDEQIFAGGHLLLAACLPWSRLEERVAALLPCLATPVVYTSAADDGLADLAAGRLRELGYQDVRVLDGGIQAWEAAGFHLFGGIHVPSKAFGELVEQRLHTPAIDAAELKALLDAGADVAVFDSRPSHEFFRMSIPGARNCPGAELVYRLPAAVPSDDTLVVVNCAGRTRSIIGTQSLINAGFPNRVKALRNGTMGWHLAGFPLDSGRADLVQAPNAAERARAQRMAQEVRERFAIRTLDAAALQGLCDAAAEAPLYVLDVRSPEEYAASHMPGVRHAPGGQLVQATDVFMAIRNARAVLVDDDGVRAAMTASWLLQLGWPEVAVFRMPEPGGPGWLAARDLVPTLPLPRHAATCSPQELASQLAARSSVQVLDLSHSEAYRAAHIPGARFALRSRFAASLQTLSGAGTLVLVSDDGSLAHAAAADAARCWRGGLQVLDGGTRAWRAAGLALASGFEDALDPAEDLWRIPSVRGEDAMREYLSWEVNLLDKVAHEPGLHFRLAAQPAQAEPVADGA